MSTPRRAAIHHRDAPELMPTPPPATRPHAISSRLSPRVNAMLDAFPKDVADDLVSLLLLPNGMGELPDLAEPSIPRRAPPLPPTLSELEQMSVRAAGIAATALERLQRPVKSSNRACRRRPPSRPHSAQPLQQPRQDTRQQERPATALAVQRRSAETLRNMGSLTSEADRRDEIANADVQQEPQEPQQLQQPPHAQMEPEQGQASLSVTPILIRAVAETPCPPPPTPRVADLLKEKEVTALWTARLGPRSLAAPPVEVHEAARVFDGLHGGRLTQADSIHRAVSERERDSDTVAAPPASCCN